jgi:hypothetical protein
MLEIKLFDQDHADCPCLLYGVEYNGLGKLAIIPWQP